MKLKTSLKLALNILVHSKLRSWLTVIGIVIGVAAVVSIISIGEGLQTNVQSRLQGLGQDIVTISAGSSRAFGGFRGGNEEGSTNTKNLNLRDIQQLKLVPGIKSITGIISGRADVYYVGQKATIQVEGLDPSTFKDFVTTDISSGRSLSQGDIKSVVIGYGAANTVFKKGLSIGSIITINNEPFRVVGILVSSSGFGGSDNSIFMALDDSREILKDTSNLANNEYSSIRVKVSDVNFLDDTVTKIENTLLNSHHVRENNKDFTVNSPAALQAKFTQVTSAITIFLGAIAAVSLLVGAIGIANTMFTSVLEKTKEIGIMKAIGAKNKDILLIFLFNSGMLGLVGGIIGISIGSLISYLLPNLGISLGVPGSNNGIKTTITFNLLLFAIVFSMLVGMIAGAIPAYRASRLKPAEALRYE